MKSKLTVQQRLDAIERVLKNNESVVDVCNEYKISRVLFYRLLKRYNSAIDSAKIDALKAKKPTIKHYYRQASEFYEQAVLSAVINNPQLSSHKIVHILPKIGGKPILGNHGVQNVLRRHALNTMERRLDYSRSLSHPLFIDSYIHLAKRCLALLFSPNSQEDAQLLRFLSYFLSGIFLSLSIIGIQAFIHPGLTNVTGLNVGHIFAVLSLGFGLLFFLYSLKYYLTIAIVLSYTRKLQLDPNLQNSEIRSGRSIIRKVIQSQFGIEIEITQNKETGTSSKPQLVQPSFNNFYQGRMGLHQDVSKVNLTSHPFVSIHLSVYNELHVIDRLMTAVTSLDYDFYEVIVADDSNDATCEKLKQWESHPKVKICHRDTRAGFKGGALANALKMIDKRAEFILIFDADFIPYPDTITQFLKYFQYTAGTLDFGKGQSNIAAVQGYQWHVVNKSENFVTRGVRSEYAGSYVVERSGSEIYGGLKQISGSVYMIRRNVLESIGWGTSITEDFELTLKLYEKGWKVVYTPYIQAPAEAVSTLRRLIRQRMRWAEGHSYNVKKMFKRLLIGSWVENTSIAPVVNSESRIKNSELNKNYTENTGLQQSKTILDSKLNYQLSTLNSKLNKDKVFIPSPLTFNEKLEFIYLAPYYLQAAFFILGTFFWLLSESVFDARLPFWTEVWGWSLVLSNMIALPLMNLVGLFMEESEEKDYQGLFSFIALSYIVAPFQAYAAIKGFVEEKEGPWFRTPKTGMITDIFVPGRFTRFFSGIFGGRPALTKAHKEPTLANNPYLALATANSAFTPKELKIPSKKARRIGRAVIGITLLITVLLQAYAPYVPSIKAAAGANSGNILTPNGLQSNSLFESPAAGQKKRDLLTVQFLNLIS